MIFQDPFGSLDARQTVYESVVEPSSSIRRAAPRTRGETESSRPWTSHTFVRLSASRRSIPSAFGRPTSAGGHRVSNCLGPELIVADEPVSMLDVSARAGILRLMVDLRDRLGVSYMFITHDLAVAWVVADRIAVVYLGRIVEIGTSEELVAAPAHPYTKALLAVSGGDDRTGEIDPVSGEIIEVLPGETPSAPRCPRMPFPSPLSSLRRTRSARSMPR